MPAARFVTFLRRSLDALARERPDVAQRLAAAMASLAIAVHVDGESALLSSDGVAVRCTDGVHDAAVEVATDRATVLALIDGAVSLQDAVLDDRVVLRGGPAELAKFDDALWLYLQGAVRAPSFPELLVQLRDA